MNNFSYIAVSDIHLNHRKTPTLHIVNNLKESIQAIPPNKINAIFIVGDLFDSPVMVKSKEYSIIKSFCVWLLQYCSDHKLVLLILEGTPDHDCRQGKMVQDLYELHLSLYPNLYFRYISELKIEYIQPLDSYILFVPDQCRNSAEEIYNDSVKLLHEHNLMKVDIALVHGFFKFQIPQLKDHKDAHDESNYLKIVNRFINVGHVHKFSFYDRIIPQGSYDRLAHNEEDKKGFVLCHVNKEEEKSYFTFIQNKKAMIYKTINIGNRTSEEVFKLLQDKLSKIPTGSYIRIKGPKSNPIFSGFDEVIKMFPDYRFSKDTKAENDEKKEIRLINKDTVYKPKIINADNIESLLIEEITLSNDVNPYQLSKLRTLINQGIIGD